MVHGAFISSEPCRFKKKKLKNPLLSAISMGDKYLLHTINKIVSMVNLLRDLIYL